MSKKHPSFVISILFLIAAALLILFGALRGETALILKQAAGICFECIGLG